MISVIVPAFNAEKTIRDCIESILSQEFEEIFELIVVDDESTDSTREIAKSFKEVILVEQKHSGPAIARNRGAKQAMGQIVVFTDSDCIAEKDWLREMILPFSEKNVSGVQGAYRTKQKELIARFNQVEIEERYEKMKKAKRIDWIGSYSAAYKKNVFLAFGGFDESFPTASGEDPELSYRMAENKELLLFNPRAIVFHRHPESLRKYLRTKFFRAYWRILLYSKHKEKIIKDSYTPQLLKLQMIIAILPILGVFTFNWKIILILIALFLAATIPFVFFALKRDKAVAFSAPFLLFLRSLSFDAGTIFGIIKKVWK